jgi:hypothetical protein
MNASRDLATVLPTLSTVAVVTVPAGFPERGLMDVNMVIATPFHLKSIVRLRNDEVHNLGVLERSMSGGSRGGSAPGDTPLDACTTTTTRRPLADSVLDREREPLTRSF